MENEEIIDTLSTDEKTLLQKIVQQKLNLFIPSIFILIGFYIKVAFDYFHTENFGFAVRTILIFISLISVYALQYYYKNILPIQKDIRERQCSLHFFTIIRKTIFPYTQEYYLFFDSVHFPQEEVSAAVYATCQVGDSYQIRVAKNSKIQLDKFDNYRL